MAWLRRGVAGDADAIRRLVAEAYAPYRPRLGREPAPVLADYPHVLRTAEVWVIQDGERPQQPGAGGSGAGGSGAGGSGAGGSGAGGSGAGGSGGAQLLGVLVLVPEPDHLLLDNLAVSPQRQGEGLGALLMGHAETRAVQLGRSELRLYTNEVMIENLGYYARRGYRETGRREQDGYRRVFLAKAVSRQA